MKQMVVIAVLILVLVACLSGCAKTEPQVSTESPSPLPTTSIEPSSDIQTQDIISPVQTTETEETTATIPEALVLVNEQDDKKGLIYLGLSMDELNEILDENDMGHAKIEDSEGSGDYFIESGWNNSYLMISFDGEKDLVDGITVSGSAPVEATSTQRGLNIGDTFNKMVELYGDDYTASSKEDDEYQIYRYKYNDHYFEVWFQADVITSWRITK